MRLIDGQIKGKMIILAKREGAKTRWLSIDERSADN